MKALVVGAGFLGREIMNVFTEEKIPVLGTRRKNLEASKNIVEIDVLDTESLSLIPDDISSLIYCVSANNSSSIAYREAYFEGISNIISYCKRKSFENLKIIFISSTGVYLENSGGNIDEESEVNSRDENYLHLLEGEKLVLNSGGLVMRLSGIYGEGRSYFVNLAKKLEAFNEDSLKWSNRIHKVDAARACLHLSGKNLSGIFNVSDEFPSLNLSCLNYIRKNIGLNEFRLSKNEELVRQGKKCFPDKLKKTNFNFKYPGYVEGYGEILKKSK